MVLFAKTLFIATKLKLHLHVTKSPKHDNLYKSYVLMLEEHNWFILTSYSVPKVSYGTHARNYKPLVSYLSHNHPIVTTLKHFILWQTNITGDFFTSVDLQDPELK